MEQEVDREALAKKMAQDVFEKYDVDHSNYIERDEAKKLILDILKKHRVDKVNLTDEKLDIYFKAADLNGDGKISLEEAEIFFRDHLL